MHEPQFGIWPLQNILQVANLLKLPFDENKQRKWKRKNIPSACIVFLGLIRPHLFYFKQLLSFYVTSVTSMICLTTIPLLKPRHPHKSWRNIRLNKSGDNQERQYNEKKSFRQS